MGALPKRKISRSRQRKRRGAIRLKIPTLVPCPKCGAKKISHRVCPHCGYYQERAIVIKKEKKKKRKE